MGYYLDWAKDGRDWPNHAASRFVEAAGMPWHVQVMGEGPAILLLHGTGAATHSWRDVMPKLAATNTEIGGALEPNAPDTPLVRFCRRLAAHDLLDVTDIALPGDRRQAALLAFREAVPAAVNQRIAHAQRAHHPRIEKVAADVIVPFDQLGALLDACDTEFSGRGLDGAVWGHISDGNLHPNVIPASERDLDEGKAAMLALGRTAMRLGGAPCAEHGVGRNPIKLQLMREMVGEAGFDAMRRIKRTLDPRGVLAPGVLGL